MEQIPRYLVCVDGEFGVQGHNKVYKITPLGDGTFKVEWGRVGGNMASKIYPISKYDSLINSKLKKGYQDISDSMQDIIEDSEVKENNKDNKKDEFDLIENDNVRSIVKRLYDYANIAISKAYKVTSDIVTQAMVDKAQKIIDKLAKHKNVYAVEDFNKELIKLFTTIPRKMKSVSDYLAGNKEDFDKILQHEQSTLDTMAGQVYKPNKELKVNLSTEEVKESMLEKMGIEMEPVNQEDIDKIKKAMGNQANKFYQAWKVKNIETEKNFNEFVKENNISNIRLLCHGSRNQNWFNIIKMGLRIRPAGAGYNGSAYGDGCYFGNPDKPSGGFQKSVGYTSLNGYWTREHENCGFVAFFDVALGEPFYAIRSDTSLCLKKIKQAGEKVWHCFVKAGKAGTINDEIIVYNINQMTIRYLVEIRNN